MSAPTPANIASEYMLVNFTDSIIKEINFVDYYGYIIVFT